MQAVSQNISRMVHDRVASSNPVTMSVNCGGPISAIAQNRDGTQVVVGGRTVFKIYNVEDDCFEEKFNLRVGKHVNLNYCALDIAWNNIDDNLLATGATNGAVVLWDLNKPTRCKQEHVFTEHKRTVNRVCFHESEHRFLLSASQDGQMKLHDIRKKEVVLNFTTGSTSVRDVQWCPSQINYFGFAAADEAGTLMIWDMRRPDKVEKQVTAHSGPVFAINWHPEDKNWLATAGRDKMIKIWDVPKSKCLHTIHSIASLARIRWRPQRKFHIASCSLLVDCSINIWDIRRPYVPFATFDDHKDVTSSLLFKNKDPHVMISGSKDSMLSQHVFRDAKRPGEDLVPSGLDLSVHGMVGHANSDRQGKLSEFHPQSSYFSKRTGDKTDHFVDVIPYMQEFSNTGQVQPVENLQSWVETAKEYELVGKPVDELCRHNSKVAANLDRHQVAQAWLTVLTLYSMYSVSETKVYSQNRTFSVLSSTTQDKSELEKARLNKDAKVETDIEEKVLDGTSGNSDEETDDREMFDTKLSSIARGQVNPDWDILFQDGEPGGGDDFSYLEGPALNKIKDWQLPSEAFHPRHEIHDREAPLEPLQSNYSHVGSTVESDQANTVVNKSSGEGSGMTSLMVDMAMLETGDWEFANIVVDMLTNMAAEGDVQTPVSMLIVLKDKLRQYVDTDLQEDWFLSYIELLGRFKQWTIANFIIKMSKLPSVSMLNQQSTSIHVNCNMCNRPLARSGWLCDRCKAIINRCCICSLPVKGMFLWCQGCSHGGHIQHMKDWLSRNIECPTGCGHVCEYT
ncbi:GATOR complex protein WDR24-like isoform X1 [Mya arenaria]|uniref:GATOR complex protein WDR24-like isoform X1 n=1 Tax=Mya arenaria TaxID=6604 RepID=UPI0022E0E1FD|nr:GATOR complex protein WDR24-like isoform X1 [Mya arenaria]XP_052813584.1 GATOR complex protein WDR24-like isoform X1 [Mya arenaria]XP_052814255.1 GATOR complex protein WDR24-like isoform X1 [Mya arenaria]